MAASGVGARIECARAAAGLSQRALADATGISQSTLSRIISGDRAAKMPEIVAIIEQATGIDVAVPEADQDQHGLMMRDPQRDAVFIGVTCTRRLMRQRSTLAHGLGHVLFADVTGGSKGAWSHRSPEEIRADAFARHLLIPIEGLCEFLGDRRTLTQSVLSEVVQRFLVSPPCFVPGVMEALVCPAFFGVGFLDPGTT